MRRSTSGGLAGAVLLLVSLIAACSAATAAIPYGGGLTDHPVVLVPTAGGDRFMHAKLLPIPEDDGRPRYLLGICEDVTDQKRAEERLRQAIP